MKKLKKFLQYFFTAILVAIASVSFYLFIPEKIETIDNTLRDYMFILRGELQHNDNIVIVDLDDQSLKEVGQWPWSRNTITELIRNLTNANVGIIGYDIIFAEKDRTSPSTILKDYKLKDPTEKLINYDKVFANILQNSPSILGYQFQFEGSIYKDKNAPYIPIVVAQRGKPLEKNFLIKAEGVLTNTELLQTNSYSSGFVNNIPDESGVTRTAPLVIEYQERIYPSLALELIRNAYGIRKVVLNYDEYGLVNIELDNLKIPTDSHGRLFINYRGAKGTFKYISAVDILNNSFDKEDIAGKVVLIGTSAAGLFDLRTTPLDSVFPGVEIHANIIDNILMEDFLHKPTWAHGANIIIIVFIALLLTLLLAYTSIWIQVIIIVISFVLSSIALYSILFEYGFILNIFFVYFTILLSVVAAILHKDFFEQKQIELLRNKFSNKVSKEVMEELLEYEDNNIFKGKEKEVTIFFSDIRSFTKISEEINNPEKLIDYLNLYMEPMSRIVTKYQGTIDKYIGDCIMAYWNAPHKVENHADAALQSSIEQLKELKILNEELVEKGLPEIKIGIGLNTGLAVVGEMGSTIRSDYTLIGDSVNLASRLESLCKRYKASLIISEFVKNNLTAQYTIRKLDLVQVKGKTKAIEIFEVLIIDEVNEEFRTKLEQFNNAVDLYRASSFEQALEIFNELKDNKEDSFYAICSIYVERCNYFKENPPVDFDGVFVYDEK